MTIDDEVIDYYTTGHCWSLAWHLHRIGGWQIYILGWRHNDMIQWHHCFVKLAPNRYLDIYGPQTRGELIERWRGWGDSIEPIGPFKDRRSLVRFLEPSMQRDHGMRTKALAHHLVRTHL